MEDDPKITRENQLPLKESFNKLKYGLSSEYFEKILFLETNLKEKFDLQIFYELIKLYNKAIEYYEPINKKKLIIYNQAIKYLFELPEAKKLMEGKDLVKLFRKKELENKFKLCEKIVTEEKVKSFIEQKTNEEYILNSINNLYNNDMNKQKNNLEKIIKEKRAKFRDKKQKREGKNHNIIKANNSDKIKEEHLEKESKIAENDITMNNNKEKKEIGEIKMNSDDIDEINNIDKEEKKENFIIDDIYDNKIVKNIIDLKQSIKLTNKTRFSEKISSSFDIYIKSYYDYFINNDLDVIINDFNQKSEYSTKQGIEISKDTLSQIRDMEYLLKDNNNEENYNNEIKNIIKGMKESETKKIKNILDEIDIFSKKNDNKYLINDSLFKEQFKLDTTKLINTYIFK